MIGYPRRRNEGRGKEAATQVLTKTTGAGKVILLVEDDPAMADVISAAIGGLAEEVVLVGDGEKALDYLFGGDDVGPATPRLVLMDVEMPRMGGIEALRRLRADERTKLLPVVMFSSSDEDEDLAESYALGANAYVYKASSTSTLPELARMTTRFWLEANEPPPRTTR